MIHVICFYWQGDRWQQKDYQEPDGYENDQQAFMNRAGIVADDLPSQYVNNLYHGVKRFANQPFKFICFTNELMNTDPEIEVRSFNPPTRVGVLPRMWMYSKEAGLFGHQVLCLDLDIVIVGSLAPLMDYKGLFCARSKFRRGEEFKLDGDIMSFRAGSESEALLWTPFIEDVALAEKETGGRERYWYRMMVQDIADRWEKIAPGKVLSYKWHVQKFRKREEPTRSKRTPRQLPLKNASIVSFHGKPRPHEAKDNWIKDYWK